MMSSSSIPRDAGLLSSFQNTWGKPEDVTEALGHPERMYVEGRELARTHTDRHRQNPESSMNCERDYE
jgi:hypothetical protein